MVCVIRKIPKAAPVTLKQFAEKRNKVLIIREQGGLGDILMHRMIFEDIKKSLPDLKITFACPGYYIDCIKDHPFIDEVIDCREVNLSDYLVSYNTSTICARYELSIAPLADKHRSDIWANHCGIELTNHNMHVHLEEEILAFGRESIDKARGDHPGPVVLISPISAMLTKNLNLKQLTGIVDYLRGEGYFVCGLHTYPVEELTKLQVPTICQFHLRQWMGIIAAADYVISVDTSTFHLAGGIGKPLVGIFSFADGHVYGRYYPTFELVQKHRKDDPNWKCGPCYAWANCPLTKAVPKPCITEISSDMIIDGFQRLIARFPKEKVCHNTTSLETSK